MILFGPVSNAFNPDAFSPTISIGTGIVVLTIAWYDYYKKDAAKKKSLKALLTLSGICLIFILSGVWRLLKTT